ncbi:hypothetical protein [uncultured Tenacibaculum sp.]|uniref:hypothetical protein n=1 Tax=uncultured Tenacibaculum sp. TaxID=174713 RepID=UPI0026016597|nr:hypothetical protein [uncultured Tenacibaculum sp.]
MNNSLSKILSDHLQAENNNAVRVQNESSRLSKGAGAINKFAFTLQDVIHKFGSVDNLLDELPGKGFTSGVKFTLVKIYSKNNKSTSHTLQEITKDLTEKAMKDTPITSSPQQHQQQNFTQPSYPNFGLGNVLGAPELINNMVEAKRSKDYQKRAEQAEEKLKDANSENRILKEKLAALEIKLATVKDRSDLERERDKLDRKGFLETEAGNTMMETLGKIIPKVIESVTQPNGTMQQAPQVLGNPGIEVSDIKSMVIEKIQSQTFSDEQTNLINYILDNWEQNFVEGIMNLINKREENAN